MRARGDQPPERGEGDDGQEVQSRDEDREERQARAGRHADRRGLPHRRRRGESVDRASARDDEACSEEPDAGDDLRRDSRRITVRVAVGAEADLGDVDGELEKQRRADADENIRTKSGWLARELALDPDGAAQNRGEKELAQHAEAQCFGEYGERLAQVLAGSGDGRDGLVTAL